MTSEIEEEEEEERSLHRLLNKQRFGSSTNVDEVQALIDKYPDAVTEINEDGMLPLHTAIRQDISRHKIQNSIASMCRLGSGLGGINDYVVSEKVILILLEAYPEGASKIMGSKGVLPLHSALETPIYSLNLINALIKEYTEGAKTRGFKCHSFLELETPLPLSLAINTKGLSDDVVLAVLEAYPDAAKDMVSKILPLHLAIIMRRSIDIIKALLDVYPKGVEQKTSATAKIVGRPINGLLPLWLSLTERASDDVLLAVLAAYPDAAKDVSTCFEDSLPMHVAIHLKRSREVVEALIDAYPGAAKEELREKNECVLHYALIMNESEETIRLVLNAYPQAAKKPFNGAPPLKLCCDNNSSEDLILALLEIDMPLRKDGTPVEHCGSWNACVSYNTEGAIGAVRRILSEAEGGFGMHIHALAVVCDDEGRIALGVASSGPRDVIYEYLLFCGQYYLEIGPPEHCSATSVVLRARDLGEQTDYGVIFDEADDGNGKLDRKELKAIASDIGLDPDLFLKGSDESTISKEEFVGICKRQLGDGEVVIKLMQKKDHWERELKARNDFDLNPKYVVSALSNVPSDTEIANSVETGEGGLETIQEKFLKDIVLGKYAIVMGAGPRNLLQIFYQEQPKIDAVRDILKQVFEAVRHLHGQKLMHGDIKMLNIVRFRIDNGLRLIDFDASARIVPIGGEDETFAGVKFSSAILPPEMIYRIVTEEQLEKFKKYWESEIDEELKKKVEPKLYKKQGTVKARYVVKSFRTEEGKPATPMFEGLPYEDEELVRASESIDLWSLGVLAFTLLTGVSLIPSTRDDDCASGNAMHVLYNWDKQPEVLSDLFNKIHDDAARHLVEQLLQYEPQKRPSVASLLENHPFFHPQCEDMLEKLNALLANQKDAATHSQDDRALLQRIDANVLVIKELGIEGKAELRRTRHALLKGIFEATEVTIPTTFIVLNNKLPPAVEQSDQNVEKILNIVAEEDVSGVRVETKYVSLTVTAEGADIDLEGDLKEYRDQVEAGIKWAKLIKDIGTKVAAGEVGKAFEIINEGIKDLIVGNEMYLYLIDELTGEPVRAEGEGWPIVITEPSELVPRLLPLMQLGMRAMSIYNGTAGLARLFGYPLPKVPKAWSEGAQESVELLKQESSVEKFAIVHAQVKEGNEEAESLRGASLRDFKNFLNENDPGLKDGKTGHFAGLHCIGDPEEGTALWTTLTNPADIEVALKKRAEERKEEMLKHNEHIKMMARHRKIQLDKDGI